MQGFFFVLNTCWWMVLLCQVIAWLIMPRSKYKILKLLMCWQELMMTDLFLPRCLNLLLKKKFRMWCWYSGTWLKICFISKCINFKNIYNLLNGFTSVGLSAFSTCSYTLLFCILMTFLEKLSSGNFSVYVEFAFREFIWK